MQPRKLVQQQFSSFAQLEEGKFRGWLTEPRLLKNMERHLHALSNHQQSSQEQLAAQNLDQLETGVFWSLYWHSLWQTQNQPLAENHLFAYLQETCYWVAADLERKAPASGTLASLNLADFFQMAMAEVKLTLEKFERSASNNLKAFAASFLACRLKSTLRQRKEADFCSDWGLLRKTSQRRVLSALDHAGLSKAEVEQYRLLWTGFNALYVGTQVGGTAKLPEPTPEVFGAIATFYNRQRTSQLSQPAPSLNATEVEYNLHKMAKWIRTYFYPAISSLNTRRSADEEEGSEIQDFLPASDQASLLEALIETEQHQARQDRQVSVQHILIEQFRQFEPQIQQILCLLYGQNLSQQAIMAHTGLSQPAISRRLAKARGQLVEALLNQLESEVNNLPDPNQLKIVSEQLKLCLQVYLRETSLCIGCEEVEG